MKKKYRVSCKPEFISELVDDAIDELDNIENPNAERLSHEMKKCVSKGDKFCMMKTLNYAETPLENILGDDHPVVHNMKRILKDCD